MRTVSIASQKGGTGKTSTAISVAAGLARKGKRVLLLDVDPQSNSSKVLLPDYMHINKDDTIYDTILGKQSLRIHQTDVPNLAVVPAHILLSNTDVELTTAFDHREARLKTALDQVQLQYDYGIIDCPPSLGWLTLNALTASDEVLVIISPGYFELDSVVQISRTIKEVQNFFNATLRIRGFLFTMADPTTNSKESLKILRQTYPAHVLNTIIPRNVDLKDASFNRKDIFDYAPHSKAAYAYTKLIEEVFP